jgi:hypothetical protein
MPAEPVSPIEKVASDGKIALALWAAHPGRRPEVAKTKMLM